MEYRNSKNNIFMRNIFLLLSCLLCLQACNDEKEVDCLKTLQQRENGN